MVSDGVPDGVRGGGYGVTTSAGLSGYQDAHVCCDAVEGRQVCRGNGSVLGVVQQPSVFDVVTCEPALFPLVG